jgi:hypothetical protein
MSIREMEIDEFEYLEVKDAVRKVQNSLFMPDKDSMIRLLQFYKKMNPRNGVCFSCSGDRAKILKYAVKFIEQWVINQ